MTATFPSGEHVVSVTKVLPDRTIVLDVKEVTKNQNLFSVEFPPTLNGHGWNLKLNGNTKTDIHIPFDVPLDSFTFFGITAATTFKVLNSKLAREKNFRSATPQIHVPGHPMCTEHDMVCSEFFGYEWPWTSNQLNIQYWAPCIGSFVTDVGDCCKEHDRAFWCAHNFAEYEAATQAVIWCITSRVFGNAYKVWSNQFSEGNLLEQLLLLNCFPYFTVWLLHSEIRLTAVMENIYLAYYAALMANPVKKNMFLNHDHQHDESCLCGGREPTVICNGDQCRDLCKEFPDAHKRENCMDCGCVCDYQNGILVGAHNQTPSGDQNNSTGCCPGTDLTCRKLFPPDPCQSFAAKCPRCTGCYWTCVNKNGKMLWELQKIDPRLTLCCNKPKQPTKPCSSIGQFF